MVSSSGLSCRSSPRISAPTCLVSGTTSSRALVIATIRQFDDCIEAEGDDGPASERRRVTRRRYAKAGKEYSFPRRALPGRDSVRAAPAGRFAPRFGLACRARGPRRAPLATQVAHRGERGIAGPFGAFHSVYEAAEQIGY